MELLSSPENFAKSLGVSIGVVRHWIAEGIIPVVRLGRRVYINIAQLRERLLQCDGEL